MGYIPSHGRGRSRGDNFVGDKFMRIICAIASVQRVKLREGCNADNGGMLGMEIRVITNGGGLFL